MTTEDRRIALAMARRQSLEYAEHATSLERDGLVHTGQCDLAIKMARMWAAVAEAMKVGEALEADGVIPEPIVGGG